MPLILFLMLFNTAHSDALLDAILGINSQSYTSYPTTTQNTYVDDSEEYFDAYGDSTEHYSWDNLYLCQYCDTEIIIDPYNKGFNDY